MRYVDTDVFVYWATDHPEHGRRATEILRHIELNEKSVTSSMSLWLFHRLMRTSQGYSFGQFLDQVLRLRNLKVVPLETKTLEAAAEAMRRFGVSDEVAVAYATARERGADAVYTQNPEFDKTDLGRTF